MVTLVSVNSHALQTNQVTLVDDAYLTGKYHEENGQTNMSKYQLTYPGAPYILENGQTNMSSKESLLQILSHFISKADTCLLAEV